MPVLAPSVSIPTFSVTSPYSTLRIVNQTGVELLNVIGTSSPTAICLNSIDDGYPNIRNVSTPISGAHGVSDTTQWFADRAITAEMTLPQGPLADIALDTIRAVLNPGSRYWLYMQRPGWASERRTLVRPATFTCPPGVLRQAQIGWSAPFGLFEDSILNSAVLSAQSNSDGGMLIPMTVPVTITGGLVAGATLINVGGNTPAMPVIDIYGPCSDPLFRCATTGQQIVFTGLTLASGDYLHIDMGLRSVTLNNDPSQSRYQRIDLTQSAWFSLPVGPAVQVVFSPDTPGPGCQAVVSWRSRYV